MALSKRAKDALGEVLRLRGERDSKQVASNALNLELQNLRRDLDIKSTELIKELRAAISGYNGGPIEVMAELNSKVYLVSDAVRGADPDIMVREVKIER